MTDSLETRYAQVVRSQYQADPARTIGRFLDVYPQIDEGIPPDIEPWPHNLDTCLTFALNNDICDGLPSSVFVDEYHEMFPTADVFGDLPDETS